MVSESQIRAKRDGIKAPFERGSANGEKKGMPAKIAINGIVWGKIFKYEVPYLNGESREAIVFQVSVKRRHPDGDRLMDRYSVAAVGAWGRYVEHYIQAGDKVAVTGELAQYYRRNSMGTFSIRLLLYADNIFALTDKDRANAAKRQSSGSAESAPRVSAFAKTSDNTFLQDDDNADAPF